jgi:hypothetical protein
MTTYQRYHQNQIVAGDEVVSHFTSGRTRHCLLKAPVQSGKTGTFNYVARRMYDAGMVSYCYIICGSSETLLRDQANQDARDYGNSDFIQVRFRQDFNELKKLGREELRNTLIIIDESHLDQDITQQLTGLFKAFGLTLDGDMKKLAELDVYILSVSATPYSEMSDITHGMSDSSKQVVCLEPGEGYRGVDFFLENDLIFKTFSVEAQKKRFVELVRRHKNKYNIVRCVGYAMEELMERIAEENGFGLYKYDSINEKDIAISNEEKMRMRGVGRSFPTLQMAPKKPSIVLIKGTLRVGKVLPKENIGFVWENSKIPKTDTAVQGLIGRVCGYHTYDIEIYVSDSLLKKREVVMEDGKIEWMNELERYAYGNTDIIPTRARNLIQPRNRDTRFFTTPVKLEWRNPEASGSVGAWFTADEEDEIRVQLKDSGRNEEQIAEVMSHFMEQPAKYNLRDDKYRNEACPLPRLQKAFTTNRAYPSISSDKSFAIFYVYPGYDEGNAHQCVRGAVYVVATYTPSIKEITSQKVPMTTRLETFCTQHQDDDDSEAEKEEEDAFLYFKRKLHDPTNVEHFREFLEHAILTKTKRIYSKNMPSFVFNWMFDGIKAPIEDKHKVRIELEYIIYKKTSSSAYRIRIYY